MTLEDLGAILAEQFIPHIMRPDDDDILIAYPMRHYKGSDGQRDLMMRMSISENEDLVRFQAFLDYGLSDVQVESRQMLFRLLLMVSLRVPMVQFEMLSTGAMFFVVEAPLRDGVLTPEQIGLCIESLIQPVDQYDQDIRNSIRMGVSKLPMHGMVLHEMMTDLLDIRASEEGESEEDSDEWI